MRIVLEKPILNENENENENNETVESAACEAVIAAEGEVNKDAPSFRGLVKGAPLGAKIMFGFTLFSLLIYAVAIFVTPFADFFNENVASYVRMALAKATSFTRASISEMVIIMMPVLIGAFIFVVTFIFKKASDEAVIRFYVYAFAIILLFFSLFVFTYGTGYRSSSIDEKLSLDRKEVSAQELADTAQYLADRMNELSEEIPYDYQSFSIMPYSFEELNNKLNDAYSKAAKKYDFILGFSSKLKCVNFSSVMSNLHVLGMYTYYTGEANINMDWPDYSRPFTCAHEMAHQRGISREDEANFMAYLVCLESDDPYIRYSAYYNVFEYVANSLYAADSDAYMEVINSLSLPIRYEMSAYAAFFEQYRESKAAVVNDKINDISLKANGQKAGSRSYDLVTDLAVAYILHSEK